MPPYHSSFFPPKMGHVLAPPSGIIIFKALSVPSDAGSDFQNDNGTNLSITLKFPHPMYVEKSTHAPPSEV